MPKPSRRNSARRLDVRGKDSWRDSKLVELGSIFTGNQPESAGPLLAKNYRQDVRGSLSDELVRSGDDDPVLHHFVCFGDVWIAPLFIAVRLFRVSQKCAGSPAAGQRVAKGYHTASHLQRTLRDRAAGRCGFAIRLSSGTAGHSGARRFD